MSEFTGELQALPSDTQAIVDLARRDAERKPEPYELTAASSIVVTRLRDDENIDVRDYEQMLDQPRRTRGAVTLHDPGDFAEYVNRLTDPDHTTVWADVNAGTVTAVLNDHKNSDTAGWRDHTVVLALRPDVDWQHWKKLDGHSVSQADFAQHIEDGMHSIVQPDAATMLEIALSLQASRSAQFSQATRLDNNDIQLQYHEETNAKAGNSGSLEVPREFLLKLTPWVGCIQTEVPARLRYRIDRGQLAIGYALLRPDLVMIEVFEGLVANLAVDLDVAKVFNGTAPRTLR